MNELRFSFNFINEFVNLKVQVVNIVKTNTNAVKKIPNFIISKTKRLQTDLPRSLNTLTQSKIYLNLKNMNKNCNF